jgi:DNA invertase Pin-like site-specific DNA recombinase
VFPEKLTGTNAERPQLQKLMKALAPGDIVIIPAVDRLSRDTTDLLIIAREMQKAGAGIRSLAEPFLDTTSDFAEIVFAILGVAAKLVDKLRQMVPHQRAALSYRRRPVSRAAMGPSLRRDDKVDAILLATRLKRHSSPSANSAQPDFRRPVSNV